MVTANTSQGYMSQFETYTGLWLIPRGEEDEDEARRREGKERGGEELGGSSSNSKVSGMRTKRQWDR